MLQVIAAINARRF